ncbi:MAG: ABC transporter substrate-binding protein [Christensenellales bacterium]|jgi:raffinose/stachyose/melibiose transport system substrate-binding protein
MKKLFCICASILICLSLLLGMASASAESLSMMMNSSASDSQRAGYEKIIQIFNETNEFGVTVEPVFYSNADYKTALSTMMASDSQPDIIFTWELGYLGNYVNGGKIISLQSYLDEDEAWVSTFNGGVLDLLTYDGEVYGIPTQQTMGIMYYNKRIFEENGLSVPATYDEFLNVCKTLKDNGVTPIALASTASDAWLVSQYIQELSNGIGGYKLFTSLNDGTGAWNDPAFVEAATLFKTEVEAGYYEDGFTGVTGDEARELFRMGLTAMYFNGAWEISSIADPAACPEAENIGAFVVPKINPENTGVTLGSVDTSFAVTTNCKNPDAAVAFIKYWTNEENATMLAYDYGRIPCTNWTLDTSRLSPLLAECTSLMTQQKNMTPWYDRVDADIGNEFNNQAVAIANGDDPQACFDALQAYAETRAK